MARRSAAGFFEREEQVKKTSIMLVSVLALCGQAVADTSDGTRGFRGTNMDNLGSSGGQIHPAPSASADWSAPQTWIFNPGVPLTADELKAQQAANTAHRRAVYDDLVQAGGCNGDFLPVEYAGPCSYTSFGRQTEGGSGSAE
jgi:hypothetical protein